MTDQDTAAKPDSGGESKGTVLVAGAANLAIAVAKIVAGLLTGSSAMLAEGAHSVADTMNQVFLLTALSRSTKPADEQHPFGYGKERYFWSLIAAIGIFVLGAGFSFFEGVHAFFHPEPAKDVIVAFAVLAVSFVFEGVSWLKAVRQLRGEAKQKDVGMLDHMVNSPDPTVKTVAFEDTAALVGILLAAGGLGLDVLTDNGQWDGVASVLIGVLLIGVAYALGKQSMAMLIGESIPQEEQDSIRGIIEDCDGVDVVVELMTMRLGPEEVLLAVRVDVDNSVQGGRLEQMADEVERRIVEQHPSVRHVFLDPTESVTEESRAGDVADHA